MHTITTRAPTADESRAINNLAGFDFGSYGCLTIFFGIVPVYVFGVIGGWIGGFTSPEAAQSGRLIGWIVAVTLFVVVLTKFSRFERGRRRLARQDRELQQVQEIHVVNPRVVELTALTDNEPVLAFDIGDDQVLFLQGQWIRDEATYGMVPVESDDAQEDFLNRLPPPHAFPSTEFTVTRLPHSGSVLGIRVSGEYIHPGTPVVAMEMDYAFGDSELFAGTLDDIAGVLQREHQRRQLEQEAS